MTPHPEHLTEKQRQARDAFDLDAFMAVLPPPGPSYTYRGQAGVRLRAHLAADISDDLLREFAREAFGARRCSEQYLDALRIVLGNQAEAERCGYALEMNQRVPFAPPNVMRTIIRQMQAAGISLGQAVRLGNGRRQVVQCFDERESEQGSATDAGFLPMYRKAEAADDARRDASIARGEFQEEPARHLDSSEADVPY